MAAQAPGSGGSAVSGSQPGKALVMTPSASAAAGERKLRLLALHGFSQDAEVFRSRIGSMRKGLRSRAEFIFVDAPHRVKDVSQDLVASSGGREDGRTWWTWEDAGRPSQSTAYTGWEESQDILFSALRDHKPVDGFVGFSQGATAAALHMATAAADERHAGVPLPSFAILVGGFLPRDQRYAEILKTARISVPSLHIYGSSDTLVPVSRSIDLMAAFKEEGRESFEHSGGHMVPTCTGEFKAFMLDFLDRMEQQVVGPLGQT